MMKILLILLTFVLSSCSATLNPKYMLNSKFYNDADSGVVLLRTVNLNNYDNLSGFNIELRNTSNNMIIENSTGLSGYPTETFYALRLPAGEYELSSVFFYNGSMSPVEEGFKFTVINSEITYVGTIKKAWSEPILPHSTGNVVGIKKYFKTNIYGSFERGGLVYILNEGEQILGKFNELFPSLSGKNVTIKPMH